MLLLNGNHSQEESGILGVCARGFEREEAHIPRKLLSFLGTATLSNNNFFLPATTTISEATKVLHSFLILT